MIIWNPFCRFYPQISSPRKLSKKGKSEWKPKWNHRKLCPRCHTLPSIKFLPLSRKIWPIFREFWRKILKIDFCQKMGAAEAFGSFHAPVPLCIFKYGWRQTKKNPFWIGRNIADESRFIDFLSGLIIEVIGKKTYPDFWQTDDQPNRSHYVLHVVFVIKLARKS